MDVQTTDTRQYLQILPHAKIHLKEENQVVSPVKYIAIQKIVDWQRVHSHYLDILCQNARKMDSS